MARRRVLRAQGIPDNLDKGKPINRVSLQGGSSKKSGNQYQRDVSIEVFLYQRETVEGYLHTGLGEGGA